ncbi:MAG: Panacea domain-containing protein [Candidatus Sulfotelmatobacter sp.]
MKKRANTKRQPKRLQPRIVPNENKFRELMLLIARKSEGDPRCGALKLNKLLFYSDFLAYLMLDKPITGQEYFALENGPAPRYMVRVREQMTAKGDIAIRKTPTVSGIQDRTFALREPDLTHFTAQEVNLVDSVIQLFWGQTGTEMSELTHRFPGWKLAAYKETIPYTVALVGDRTPTEAEKKFGGTLEALAAACLAEDAAALG